MSALFGLFPAAGRASRLGEPGASKEILAIGIRPDGAGGERPVLVCENLLAAFRAARCSRVLVLRRPEKDDIDRALGDGSRFGVALDSVVVPPTRSVPETIDQAYPRIRDCDVALGFPDVLAQPPEGLAAAVERRQETAADVVLALYPTDRPHKCDMVEVDANRVRTIQVKPVSTELTLTWLFATWGPRFTALLHAAVARAPSASQRELAVSDVLMDAIQSGMRVEAVSFPTGSHIDVGTPDDLARARGLLDSRTTPPPTLAG